ncbi:MAG: DEAD/DEAH box helicase [Chloroflexota bacterium]|nr:DEAD/DEAH box helicase [Chloroflexota bacterium]MDE3102020.1 DEAD/DEAH box helicase [Chloroflexota bacterium]
MRTDVRFPARTSLEQILEGLERDATFASMLTRWERRPAVAPRYAPFPAWLDERIVRSLRRRGIEALYSHQAAALDAAHARRHTVVVTPTASGKTLCYDLPVLHEIAKDPSARALFIFPTKALAQDQLGELERLSAEMEIELKTYTYDGDTPPQARAAIRSAGHVVITNPDMLHTGVLPHHTKWVKLFESLRYVVLDELHTYRGVFGSNVANVLRRLRRICAFYGSHPTFICTSATIANPEELARRHVEDDVVLIDESGAPQGEKVLAFVQPPVVNAQLGIRRSALLTGRDIAATLLASGIQTICFTRARVQTELLLTYLRARFPEPQWPPDVIRGYRGGYLPSERRAIERGLRDGSVRGVVSTNALELGIDIGALQAAVLVGYPGSVASTLQQMGRAGRRGELSAAFLVATSSPTDQYVVQHPGFVLERPPEQGLVNADNLHVLVQHLKCAAFELPFERSERFGTEDTPGVLGYLDEQGILHEADGRYHWSAQAFPAEAMSLRTASNDNVVIIDTTGGRRRVIGEVDRFAAPVLVHEQAIYLHESRQYQVDRLDWPGGKAYVTEVKVDHYTDAGLSVRVRVLDEFASDGVAKRTGRDRFQRAHGEVLVTALATVYKKLTMYTHENVGWGKIDLPEQELQTTSYWLSLAADATPGWPKERIEVALAGLGNLLHGLAPLFLMCEPHDLGLAVEVRSPHTRRPTIHLFDMTPGGVGFSERLFRSTDVLLERAREHLAACDCDSGCPSCVGPAYAIGADVKASVAELLG